LTSHRPLTACALTGHALHPCLSWLWRRSPGKAGSQPVHSGTAMQCILRQPD